jgi:nitrous oxidase accessory protein
MKKLLTSSIVLLALLIAAPVMANTLVVPDDYATIQDAIVAASDGDIINVQPGTYAGGITVDKSVSIRGVKGADVTLVAPLEGENGFQVIASDVTISGFTISGATDWQRSGVIIGGLFPGDGAHLGVSDVTVSKCILESNCQGIYIWKAANSMIVNNTVRNNFSVPGNVDAGNGIIAWEGPSPGTHIVNNEIYSNDKFGIFVGGSVDADYSGTKINGNNLYLNGFYRSVGYTDPGANWLGMGFMNALGSIKVSGNKILATASGLEVWVSIAPDVKVVGNPVRDDLSPNIPMPTP